MTKEEPQIGIGWIAAIVGLLLLLAVGLVLYFRLSAPLNQPVRRAVDGYQPSAISRQHLTADS